MIGIESKDYLNICGGMRMDSLQCVSIDSCLAVHQRAKALATHAGTAVWGSNLAVADVQSRSPVPC
eukprot:365347-Chlamydomonas_euryale.AAC.16